MPHLTDEDLISYRDGELEEKRRRAVSAHLETCERCREQLARFEQDLRLFRQRDPATYSVDVIPPSERLADLERSLRVWTSTQMQGRAETLAPSAFPPSEIADDLRRAVGPEALAEALTLIRAAGSERARLAESLRAFLVARLGESAADKMAKKVLAAWDQFQASEPPGSSR
jgi:anti-sigma factor RsiW